MKEINPLDESNHNHPVPVSVPVPTTLPRSPAVQLCASEWERTSSRWLQVEDELLRERGLFGPGPGVLLNRGWVQDEAEGPNRTRPRIRRMAQRRSKRVGTVRN